MMFIRNTDKDIRDEEFEAIISSHYDNVKHYMISYVIPETIAFYLATGYYGSCMYEEPLKIHINSIVAELFNYSIEDMMALKKEVKAILKLKYNLEVEDEDPLSFK